METLNNHGKYCSVVTPQGQRLVKRLLCSKPQDDIAKAATAAVGNLGTAADAVRPAVALGATAAGASRGLSSPLAASYLGGRLASMLDVAGKVGGVIDRSSVNA
jgi:hypothetical protein